MGFLKTNVLNAVVVFRKKLRVLWGGARAASAELGQSEVPETEINGLFKAGTQKTVDIFEIFRVCLQLPFL